MVLNIILFLVSLGIIICVLHFDFLNIRRIIVSSVVAMLIQLILYFTTNDISLSIKYTLLLSLAFVAAWTDLREDKILKINKWLLYLFIILFLLYDSIFGNFNRFTKCLIVVGVTFLICIALYLLKAISIADIPLVLSLVYLWPDYIIYTISLFTLVLALYGIPCTIYKKVKKKERAKYVAAAPSAFITILIFTILSSCLNTINVKGIIL